MPYYDFICLDCHQKARLFLTYAQYDNAQARCPHCQGQLKRRIGRVALAKSEDARMDSLMDDSALTHLDEDNPKAIGQFMRKMSQEVGEDMGQEFNEVVGRLESGESPDSIEKSLPDLGASSPAASADL